MKLSDIFKVKVECIHLGANQVISMRGNLIRITCQSGALFVTWPKGQEKILLAGEHIFLSTWGKICIMAFSASSACFQKKGLIHSALFYHKTVMAKCH